MIPGHASSLALLRKMRSHHFAKRAETEAQPIIVERIENTLLTPTVYSALR